MYIFVSKQSEGFGWLLAVHFPYHSEVRLRGQIRPDLKLENFFVILVSLVFSANVSCMKPSRIRTLEGNDVFFSFTWRERVCVLKSCFLNAILLQ